MGYSQVKCIDGVVAAIQAYFVTALVELTRCRLQCFPHRF